LWDDLIENDEVKVGEFLLFVKRRLAVALSDGLLKPGIG
jgi:hypothetical protein